MTSKLRSLWRNDIKPLLILSGLLLGGMALIVGFYMLDKFRWTL